MCIRDRFRQILVSTMESNGNNMKEDIKLDNESLRNYKNSEISCEVDEKNEDTLFKVTGND